MTDIKQTLDFKKSTKNTHVFMAKEGVTNPPITSLYINKVAMNSAPKTITITVTSE